MTAPETFQRARRPEQKEERRLHLLETAKAALRNGMEVSELGLNELARRAEMTKSNVYRYFENREALLLALLEEETGRWQQELDERLAAVQPATGQQLAQAFAGASAAYPLMCRLLSILPSIIERNISQERLKEFKLRTIAMTAAVADLLHARAPALPAAAYITFMRLAIPLMIGLWPLSHPAPALCEVLAAPELEPLRYEYESELAAALLLLLRGLGSD